MARSLNRDAFMRQSKARSSVVKARASGKLPRETTGPSLNSDAFKRQKRARASVMKARASGRAV